MCAAQFHPLHFKTTRHICALKGGGQYVQQKGFSWSKRLFRSRFCYRCPIFYFLNEDLLFVVIRKYGNVDKREVFFPVYFLSLFRMQQR